MSERFIVGFTGTRHGMTQFQKNWVKNFATMHLILQFHHGDCIGSDAEAHAIMAARGIPIYIHPSNLEKQRAFCRSGRIRSVYEPAEPLYRNRVIVNGCNLLLATPSRELEEKRSGTWATIRYAHRRGVQTICIGPERTFTYVGS